MPIIHSGISRMYLLDIGRKQWFVDVSFVWGSMLDPMENAPY